LGFLLARAIIVKGEIPLHSLEKTFIILADKEDEYYIFKK